MLRVEAYAVTEGLHVRVHGVCTGMAHEADPCIPFGVSTVIPTERIERWGIEVALVEAVSWTIVQSPELAELIMH